jgi:membrane dipeptidase
MDDMRRFFVFDAHCDTAQRLTGGKLVDLGERLADGHVDLPRMAEGGVGAQVFACWVDPDLNVDRWMPDTLEMIEAIHGQAGKHSDRLAVALSGTDVASAKESGRRAALIGIEGGHVLGGSVARLEEFYRAGVRCLTLTWMNTNEIADSSDGEMKWNGLSPAGREVIAAMDRVGMVIDLSHASDGTFFDVIEASSAPVLVSHSSSREICDIPRNISDEMLRALAENGGVACVNFFPAFLDKECHTKVFGIWGKYREERSRLAAEYGGDPKRVDEEIGGAYIEKIRKIPMPGIEAVADHVEHMASVAGVSHTGIGSDFDGIMVVPPGLEDVSKMQALAAVLAGRGWNDDDIAAVMGDNLLRLFSTVCG